MADIEEPADLGRIRHLTAQMHKSEDDAGDPIPDGYVLAADGARGHTWTDPTAFGDPTTIAALVAAVFGYSAHGSTGATETFDASVAGWHSATLNADCAFTFSGTTSGEAWGMILELTQDGTGSHLVTWPGSVVWPGGVAPTLSTAAGAVDIFTVMTRDGGTTWFGFPTGGSTSGGTSATDANIWRPLLDGSGAVLADGSGQAVMAYGPA